MGLRLALVADVHMRDRDHEAVAASLDRIVDRVTSFDPAQTVVLGDLIEDDDPAADERNVERVLDALAPLDPRYLAGNHDVEHFSAEEFAALVGGDLWGHESIAGTDLVYLDTSAAALPRARSEVSEEQLAMLGRVLAESEETLVFAHHPVHYRDLSANPWFGEKPELAFCASKVWIQRVFDEHGGVLATFNGHVHENCHATYRGVDHFTVSAVNKERPDSEGPTGTHALVTLDDRLLVEVYDDDGFVREWAVPR
ncbi:MAG: metallophosphoesterase [Haloarculaceae archaeon]